MRHTKFRGFATERNAWRIGYLEITPDKRCFIKSLETGITYRVAKESVGQFTGGYDCYGHDIYEGDLLADDEGNVYKVYYDESDSMFELDGEDDILNFMDFCHSDFKVIGNTYKGVKNGPLQNF